MTTRRQTLRLATAAASAIAGASRSALAQAPAGKVTVATSFSKDVTDPFKRAFEKAAPGVLLEVRNLNTNAAVRFIQETRANNSVDLMWASAPDAFEVLKGAGLLERYVPQVKGIPEKVGAFPVNDPDGFYVGFAASGYGIMWNTRYVQANRLPAPQEWIDLAKPEYFDHVAIAQPSRSGTTHLTLEAILQGEGWDKGWRTIKAVSGNLRQVTERSFGVPDAVNSGQIGFGIVIDFFAFSAQGAGFPVKFVYPTVTTIVPANVAIVKNAPNAAGARAFVEFILSDAGQEVLLEPTIRRLPVNPATYAKAPPDYPNPFTGQGVRPATFRFDVDVSERRYAVVDALYDQLVTFQLEALRKATRAIHDVEIRLARRANDAARKALDEARELLAAMPVTAAQAASEEIAGAFKGGSGTGKAPRQAELEQQWQVFARERYAAALAKAGEAAKLAN